jgi:hypothetical protein
MGELRPTPPLALLERRRQPPDHLWSRGVASRRSQREMREGIEWSYDVWGVELAGLHFVLTGVLPDSLFHSGCDLGHRPRLLLLGHGGAPGEHALVRAGDL